MCGVSLSLGLEMPFMPWQLAHADSATRLPSAISWGVGKPGRRSRARWTGRVAPAGKTAAINMPVTSMFEARNCALRFIDVPSNVRPNLQYPVPAGPAIARFRYSENGGEPNGTRL